MADAMMALAVQHYRITISVLVYVALRCLGLRLQLVHGRRMVIVDGDTIKFERRDLFRGRRFVRGRLRGIDAPEYSQPQGAGSTRELRALLVRGRLLVVTWGFDLYGRDLIWLIGLRGFVGTTMIWRGQAFATTLWGKPLALIARIFGRGMWSKGRTKVVHPDVWRLMNDHSRIR